jgi:hypothetical protein
MLTVWDIQHLITSCSDRRYCCSLFERERCTMLFNKLVIKNTVLGFHDGENRCQDLLAWEIVQSGG